MSAEPLLAERERQIAAEVHRKRRGELAALGRDALLWLAVTPSWTWPLARACGYPAKDLDSFVAAAQDAGVCRVVRTTRADDAQELRLLTTLAEYLSPALVSEAVRLALEAEESAERVNALVTLARVADPELRREILDGVLAIGRPGPRATALIGVFPFLTPPDQERLLLEAIDAVTPAVRPDRLPASLAQLARCLPVDRRDDLANLAASAAEDLADPAEQASALIALADLVPSRSRLIVRQIGRVQDRAVRVRLLLDLVADARVGGPSSPIAELVRDAAEDARLVVDPVDRDLMLLEVTKTIARLDLPGARELAVSIEDAQTRSFAYGYLASCAPRVHDRAPADDLLGTAASVISSFPDPASRLTVAASILALDPSLPQAPIRELVEQAVAELPDTAEAAAPLRALARVRHGAGDFAAAGELAERGLRSTERIADPARRMRVGLGLTPYLSPSRASVVLREYAAEVTTIDDFATRLGLLGQLVPQLEGVDRARVIEDSLRIVRTRGAADSFWMPEAVRRDVLGQTGGTGASEDRLHSVVRQVAERIMTAAGTGTPVPSNVLRWARFAREVGMRGGASRAARFLDQVVTEALGARDLPGALDWIDTARLLASTLGNELEGSVRYAARRVELLYRQRQDARQAVPLLLPDEQVAAFEALLADDGEAWALHYLGAGGVGKSTVVGHLARSADKYAMAVGRVDFDYLTPDYPLVRPGQLLLELMAELQLYATGDHQESIVAAFHQNVARVHRLWTRIPPADRPRPIDDPDFQALLRTFCDYLILLGRRVVLFLDTCEELARWQPSGGYMPNVSATFEIVQRLRDQLAQVGVDLRVVFAGRRPLAAGNGPGAGSARWRVDGRDAEGLPVRPFLRMHEIRGFTRRQADRYLSEVRKLDVPTDVLDEVLARSEDRREVRVQWPRAQRRPDEPRYLPFDLALYADWLLADGRLTAEEIRRGGVDPYIDRRIVGRIRSAQARTLLPVLALVRRADVTLLESVFDGDHETFRAAFETLADHEWIRRSAGPDPAARVELQIEPRMHRRLLAYYQREDRVDVLNDVRRRLLVELRTRLQRNALGDLPPLLVDDILQMLPEDEAADQVHQLILSAAAQERWDWIEDLVRQLLGEDGLVGRRPEHPARGVVEAAHASWLTHDGRATEAQSFWGKALTSARLDSDAVRRQWLVRRAILGRGPWAPGWVEGIEKLLGEFDEIIDTTEPEELVQLVASCCAVLDLALDDGPEKLAGSIRAWYRKVRKLALPDYLWMQLKLIEARCLDPQQAVDAVVELADAALASSGQVWLDLVVPESIRDRTRLQLLDVVLVGNDLWLRTWSAQAGRSIDGERLRSKVLEVELAQRPATADVLDELLEWDRFDTRPRPTRALHRRTLPLFVSIAQGLLSIGRSDEALSLLNERLHQATASEDTEAIRAAELEILRVLRRTRLTDHRYLVDRCARSDDEELREAALAVIALTGSPAAILDVAPDVWRYQCAFGPGARERLREFGEERGWHRTDRSEGDADLDRVEWAVFTGADVRTGAVQRVLVGAGDQPVNGTMMRAFAFSPGDEALVANLRAPYRQLGELAFSEGELLALRLPWEGAKLLDLAAHWFELAGDSAAGAQARLRGAIARAQATPGRVSDSLRDGLAEAGAVVLDHVESGSTSSVRPRDGWEARARLAQSWPLSSTDHRQDSDSLPVELQANGYDHALTSRRRSWRLWPATAAGVGVLGFAAATYLQWQATGKLGQSLLITVLGAFVLFGVPFGLLRLAGLLRSAMTAMSSFGADVRLVVRARGVVLSKEPWPDALRVTIELRVREPDTGGHQVSFAESLRLLGDFYLALLTARRARMFRGRDRAVATAEWRTPSITEKLSEAVESFPREILDPVLALRADLGTRPLRIHLDTSLEEAGLAWEAIVAAAIRRDEPDSASVGAVQINRLSAALPPVAAPTHSEVLVSVAAPPAWWRGAVEAWMGFAGLGPDPGESGLGEVTVVHAIGRAVTSSMSGDWLQVADEPRLLSADALTAGETTALVLLQAPPYVVEQRTATDRAETARLKRLAHGVFANGTWAVLVVPTLPPELATAVVRRLAEAVEAQGGRWYRFSLPVFRRVQDEDPLAGRLRRAQNDAQKLIRDWGGWASDTGPELARELADDVCLFVRDAGPMGDPGGREMPSWK